MPPDARFTRRRSPTPIPVPRCVAQRCADRDYLGAAFSATAAAVAATRRGGGRSRVASVPTLARLARRRPAAARQPPRRCASPWPRPRVLSGGRRRASGVARRGRRRRVPRAPSRGCPSSAARRHRSLGTRLDVAAATTRVQLRLGAAGLLDPIGRPPGLIGRTVWRGAGFGGAARAAVPLRRGRRRRRTSASGGTLVAGAPIPTRARARRLLHGAVARSARATAPSSSCRRARPQARSTRGIGALGRLARRGDGRLVIDRRAGGEGGARAALDTAYRGWALARLPARAYATQGREAGRSCCAAVLTSGASTRSSTPTAHRRAVSTPSRTTRSSRRSVATR